MNLFGEPELGVDYINYRRPCGQLCRLYKQICTYCNNVIYRSKVPGRKIFFCNRNCQGLHFSNNRKRENNPNWKGGRKSYFAVLYSSREYKEWRDTIFGRDDYTCSDCSQYGGDLEAHHIYPVSAFPEKVFDVDNGITLCTDCHKKIRRKEFDFIEKYLLLI